MTDLETIKRVKMYIDKLANGINPLNNFILPQSDIVNNVHISRCLFYTSDILRQIIESDKNTDKTKKNNKKEDFYISFENIQKFSFSDTPVPASKIAEKINELNPNDNMKKFSYRQLTDWLVSIGMLYLKESYDGKTIKRPTENGSNLGITTELRHGTHGNYTVVLYNRDAQQFIIDNIDSIIADMHK